MPGNYSVRHAKKVIERKGRIAGERGLQDKARELYGRTGNLTAKQVARLVKLTMNSRRLALTQKKKQEVVFLLQANRKLPPPERLNFEQISNQTGVSTSRIKKLNVAVRKGKTKVMATSRERAQVPKKARDYLAKHLNAGMADVMAATGLSKKQFQRIMAQYNTSFASERRKARLGAIKKLDQKTGGKLSNAQIAKQLGLKKDYVAANRPRRGRGSGHAARREKNASKFLGIIGLFTTLNRNTISLERLMKITGVSKPDAYAALKRLKKEGLIIEGDLGYGITKKGIGYRNTTGATPGNFFVSIKRMGRRELESTYRMVEEIEKVLPRGSMNQSRLLKVKQRLKTELADRVLSGERK